MSISDIIKEAENYRAVYSEGMNKIDQLRNATEYTDEYKSSQIQKIEDRYEGAIKTATSKVIEAVEKTKAELKGQRLKSVEAGLNEAEKITAITNGIKSGAYNADMVKDIAEVYKGNPALIEAVRTALNTIDDDNMKTIAGELPTDNTYQIIDKLDKAGEKFKTAPNIKTKLIDGDMSSQLWRSGAGVDSVISFLAGLEE